MGSEGENGDIVVTLVTEGLNDRMSAQGIFDAEDLQLEEE